MSLLQKRNKGREIDTYFFKSNAGEEGGEGRSSGQISFRKEGMK